MRRMGDASHIRFRPHPWHGLSPGPEAPDVVAAYVEITPFDLVKYEVDKLTGYLRVDRPQRGAASPPTLYGFIPRTFCAERVRALCPGAARGDGDPLDICIVSERPIDRAEILLTARVVGGIQMVDHDEADDKILAVLDRDAFWSTARDITDLPPALVARLRHYLATYKLVEGEPPRVRVQETYGAAHARRVVEAALADYVERFGEAP
jgi:inorganic pyrophosphatase